LFSSTTFTPIEHHNHHDCETSFKSPNGQGSKTVMEEKNDFVLRIGIGFCKACHQSKKSFNNKWVFKLNSKQKLWSSKLQQIEINYQKSFKTVHEVLILHRS